MISSKFEFILYVADQQRSAEFYSKVLERAPSLNVPGMTEFNLSNDVKLGLMPETGISKILQGKTPSPSSGNGIPRCELYFYTEQIDAIFKNALAADATLVSPISERNWGDKVGYLSDPDGHIIAFAERV